MYTSQIARALRSDPKVSSNFVGVFASDRLPVSLSHYPASIVVNTDPAHKPGTHWIACYFDKNRHLDYFDSYGDPPNTYNKLAEFASKNSSTLSYNDQQLQGPNTDVCGHYCIAFLTRRVHGETLGKIISRYGGGRKPGSHDAQVAKEVGRRFGIKRLNMQGRAQNKKTKNEQCCCCCSQNKK
jgi:hypothetical protein